MPKKKFWEFRNEAESETAELLLYGEISDVSWWGDEITPKQFHEDLLTCEGKDLAVHINSPGGDVFAAQAIYNQLKNYTGKVTMYIDGMCASAATIIACAGDSVIMPTNTIYMIHNPKSAMLGYFDAPQLDKLSASLTTVKQTIVNVYMARVKDVLSEVQLKHKMDNEEWMTAQTAKEYGFVDEVVEAIPIENRLEGNMLFLNSVSCKLDRFQNAASLQELIKNNIPKRSEPTMNDNEFMKKLQSFMDKFTNSQPNNTPPAPTAPPNNTAADSKEAILAEERKRVADLEAMKNGNPAVDAIIETAKANGATADSVKPYVDAIPQQEPATQDTQPKNMYKQFMAMLQDSSDSGANGVLPTPHAGTKNEAAQKAANIEEVANYANHIMEVK
ncbi:MAG: Clp protease ClpP [Selenomonas ruminantium]|uniref:ATP-dependent Clp protease proteolytic subunit n=1 Tax=Selenomonas ruminantium TaxID=971 RepID=A0A927WQN3_SELRU|nr:Clp protease ClpP [Selenomonas ruminantium]